MLRKKSFGIIKMFVGIMLIFLLTRCDNGIFNTNFYQLGSTGPGGGIVFYDKGNDSNGWRYLEYVLIDQGTRFMWATTSNSIYMDVSTEANATVIGTGKRNTDLILEGDPTAPEALACKNYNGGGKIDWFLPSRDELSELLKQRDKAIVWAWSSSQLGKNQAIALHYSFKNATPDGFYKNFSHDVFAIRAF